MSFTQLGIDSVIHKVCDSSSSENFKTCVYVYFKFCFVILLRSLLLPINPELDRDFKPIIRSCRKYIKLIIMKMCPMLGPK